jgi:drug/metabolite transporter (DMT)-like permease
MAWALLGEVPSWLALAGGALCLAGVALTRRAPTTAGRGTAGAGQPKQTRR